MLVGNTVSKEGGGNIIIFRTKVIKTCLKQHSNLHKEREGEDRAQEGLRRHELCTTDGQEQRSHDQQEEGDGDRPQCRDDEAVDEVELVHARQVERGQQVEVEDLG